MVLAIGDELGGGTVVHMVKVVGGMKVEVEILDEVAEPEPEPERPEFIESVAEPEPEAQRPTGNDAPEFIESATEPEPESEPELVVDYEPHHAEEPELS